jgi:hypothetical protein
LCAPWCQVEARLKIQFTGDREQAIAWLRKA